MYNFIIECATSLNQSVNLNWVIKRDIKRNRGCLVSLTGSLGFHSVLLQSDIICEILAEKKAAKSATHVFGRDKMVSLSFCKQVVPSVSGALHTCRKSSVHPRPKKSDMWLIDFNCFINKN